MMTPSTTPLATFETAALPRGAMTGSAVMAIVRAIFSAIAIMAAIITSVSALYLAKSALGINLLPGHSFLHDLLFPLLR